MKITESMQTKVSSSDTNEDTIRTCVGSAFEPLGFEKHYDPHDINVEWTTDFYAYFDAPENATRYTPTIQFLQENLASSFSILDMACGSGILLKFLPRNCQYTGVDHSIESIKYCRENFPERSFVQSDVIGYLNTRLDQHQGFDALVMSGLLFNSVDYETYEKIDDLEILSLGLKVLNKSGYLCLIVPFVFSDHNDFDLMRQASWKWDSIKKLIQHVQGKIVLQNMSVQVGLNHKIEQQNIKPDWYFAKGEGTADRWQGTYMGSWNIILESVLK